MLCAAFVLETRGHRNLFYATALPVFLLSLPRAGWRDLGDSWIARLGLAYLAYYLLSALWSDGLDWGPLADLLRVTFMVLLFFVTTVLLAARNAAFEQRFFLCYALSAGASLVAVYAAAAGGLLDIGWRLTGFGLTSHPVIGATLYGVALLVCAFVLLPQSRGWSQRLLWFGILALCVAFLLLSASRGPLLALAAAVVAGLTLADRRIAIALLCLVLAAGGAALFADLQPVQQILARGQSGHFEIWQQTLAAIAERPWFGHGSLVEASFEAKHGASRSPHNLLLANQFYGGLPASLLLGALLALAAWRAFLAARGGRPIYLVLLVFGLAAALFDTRTLVQNLGREWITLWLPLALLAGGELRARRTAAFPGAS